MIRMVLKTSAQIFRYLTVETVSPIHVTHHYCAPKLYGLGEFFEAMQHQFMENVSDSNQMTWLGRALSGGVDHRHHHGNETSLAWPSHAPWPSHSLWWCCCSCDWKMFGSVVCGVNILPNICPFVYRLGQKAKAMEKAKLLFITLWNNLVRLGNGQALVCFPQRYKRQRKKHYLKQFYPTVVYRFTSWEVRNRKVKSNVKVGSKFHSYYRLLFSHLHMRMFM